MSADDDSSVLDNYGDEDSFHPLGSDWESEMEAQLEETEYDTELGLQMAKDAMLVTADEMSEAEFHAKYHERVLDEFGVDDRPTAEAWEEVKDDGGFFDRLADIDIDDDESRRDVMKKMGAGAAFLGLGAWSTVEDPEPEEPSVAAAQEDDDEEGTQWGMVIDLERCDGCLQCVAGCQNENGWDQGMNWMYVLSWQDEDNPVPDDAGPQEMNYLVRPCQHCTEAPCEKVCPTTARHTRQKDGLVLTDYDVCIGCRYCQVACPYGVNYFAWDEPDVSEQEIQEATDGDHIYADYSREGEEEDRRRVDSRAPKGVMSKCTMCPTRQDGNMGEDAVGTVACMEACDNAGMSAIHFGDLNDDESRPNRYLEAKTEQAAERGPNFEEPEEEWFESTTEVGNLSSFRLLEGMGTEPNIIYIGDEPGPNAEQIEGPVAYEDIRQTDARKDVTDEGTFGGDLFG